MRVLGLETSCDETAAAVVETGEGLRGRVLADVVHTQKDVHEKWGGVVPELASRDHLQRVLPVLDEALRKAGCELRELDGISVTRGPGLVGALLVGVQVGKSLAAATGLPLIGVNHIEGHLLAVLLAEQAPAPPWLALVVSGGHTSLYDVRALGEYRALGHTLDDAAGEAFDKVAKLLGLPYPGGAHLDRLARGGKPKAIDFPRGLARRSRAAFDFSFSGLKTAVLTHVREYGVPSGQALSLDQGHHVTVAALDSDERPRIEHEHQAAPRPCRPGPRTTTARSRARRAASCISSAVISPCSAS